MITHVYHHFMGRFYQVRSSRALARYHRLKAKSEKFFRRIPRVEADARDDRSDRALAEGGEE